MKWKFNWAVNIDFSSLARVPTARRYVFVKSGWWKLSWRKFFHIKNEWNAKSRREAFGLTCAERSFWFHWKDLWCIFLFTFWDHMAFFRLCDDIDCYEIRIENVWGNNFNGALMRALDWAFKAFNYQRSFSIDECKLFKLKPKRFLSLNSIMNDANYHSSHVSLLL